MFDRILIGGGALGVENFRSGGMVFISHQGLVSTAVRMKEGENGE